MRIFLIGYMGSGKTTIGKLVAARLGFEFIDSDHYIEKQLNCSVAHIFSEYGEEKFRLLERDALMEIANSENVIVATGGGAPCFHGNMDFLNQCGETIYINLTAKELFDRLITTNIKKRPLLAGKSDMELDAFIQENLAGREAFYLMAKHYVSGNDEEIAEKIISIINSTH